MGRKARRNRHDDDDDHHNEEEEETTKTATQKEASKQERPNSNSKELDFAQRRELQRQQAAQKRQSKQKCYLCGNSGHVRRECPGIQDDGRGMSRYKGKSDPKLEKQKYRARKDGEDATMPFPKLEYPKGFVSFLQEEEEEESFVYYDAGCDISATIKYLRFGRGKHKISQKEAIEEYQTALDHAAKTCCFGGMISRTLLPKPNRPWIDPSPFTNTATTTNVYYVLGLSSKFMCYNDDLPQEAIQSLIETLQTHQKKTIGVWSALTYTPDFLSQPGCDRDSQLRRLRCCCEAAGRTKVPLQVQTSPGATGLDPEQSVAGTDYAKVLLDLQTILSESVTKYPGLLIHLSCWSGRADHMMSLLNAFPNNLKVVGMDGSVSFSKATHLHECAFEIPLTSLVLETSTVIPSHVANALGRDASFHSGWWPFVAEAVAHYKKVPIADVARAASDNTLQLYPQLRLQSSDETQNNSPVLEECQEAETTSDA